jgi:hypothetical protein
MPDDEGMEQGRVHVRERVTVQRWDHDCPTLHGGTCAPEVVVLEWCDGEPVEPDDRHWEGKDAATDARA